MAKKNRHNAAFVVGSVVGAAAGAAAALWKTPYSGEEVRAKITNSLSSGSGSDVHTGVSTSGSTHASMSGGSSLKDKVLGKVEQTLAPVVGVNLGKTANGSTGVLSGTGTTQPAAVADTVDPKAVERGEQLITGGTVAEKNVDAWSDYGSGSIRSARSAWGNETGSGVTDTQTTAETDTVRADEGSVFQPTQYAAPTTEDSILVGDRQAMSTSAGEGTVGRDDLSNYSDASVSDVTDTSSVSRPAAVVDEVDPAAVERGEQLITGGTVSEKNADAWSDYGSGSIRASRSNWGGSSSSNEPTGNATTVDADNLRSGETFTFRGTETGTSVGRGGDLTQNVGSGKVVETTETVTRQVGVTDGDGTRHDAIVMKRGDEIQTGEGTAQGVSDGSVPLQDTHPEAASVDTLLTPQANAVPEALQAQDKSAMHPFPKLGGLER